MRSPRRKAPSVPASLQRSASASNRRFSLPENWRRLAIATTSGSRRAAASEAVSPVALRAPSATASEEQPNDPFIEDFSNEFMCMSYLYSKLPETGVSPHIGTGGGGHWDGGRRSRSITAWCFGIRILGECRRTEYQSSRCKTKQNPLHRSFLGVCAPQDRTVLRYFCSKDSSEPPFSYTVENTQLVHHACHRSQQAKRGFP